MGRRRTSGRRDALGAAPGTAIETVDWEDTVVASEPDAAVSRPSPAKAAAKPDTIRI
jgi:hypothetical protein